MHLIGCMLLTYILLDAERYLSFAFLLKGGIRCLCVFDKYNNTVKQYAFISVIGVVTNVVPGRDSAIFFLENEEGVFTLVTLNINRILISFTEARWLVYFYK